MYLLIKRSRIILWTLDSGDTWRELPKVSIHSRGFKNKNDVILLHDFDREDVTRNKYVLNFSEKILKMQESLKNNKIGNLSSIPVNPVKKTDS